MPFFGFYFIWSIYLIINCSWCSFHVTVIKLRNVKQFLLGSCRPFSLSGSTYSFGCIISYF
uniref:Putative ovule protein n=1 Tax=Solanum chacoense TaxID=4108 RepID=A0A0V0I150_SOLCH